MGKKRVLSLILMLMIVICCVTEAFVIGELKKANDEMAHAIEDLNIEISDNSAAIEQVSAEVEKKAEEEIPVLYLPEDIYVCAGLTMEIYDDCVSSGVNLEDYDFYWECEVGDCMEEKYRIHADAEDVGEYTLTLHVYDLHLSEVASARTTLHVVPNVFSEEGTGSLSMLTIGDSMSASTDWLSYTRFLSGDKLSHLGTLGDTEGLMNEGRPGITALDYLEGTLYGEPADHPFINPQTKEFDWNYYKQSTGLEPDVVQVFLGTNGLEMDPVGNSGSIVEIVNRIREADPDIQIMVVQPIYPSYQDGMARQQNIQGFEGLHGMWSLARSQMIFNLIGELEKELADYDNVTIVPAAVMFDRDYGFDQSEIRENPHSEVLDSMPVQGVHPSAGGYDQIGDVIYSTLCWLIDEGKLETAHVEETGE
ncbi:MAG: SGNH/GDSL hydrolase family protein [Lachnospiraceae bacterium]|nr:SGNH/GDSL hydrolase family protein [Lachnospiraceae bacterium]